MYSSNLYSNIYFRAIANNNKRYGQHFFCADEIKERGTRFHTLFTTSDDKVGHFICSFSNGKSEPRTYHIYEVFEDGRIDIILNPSQTSGDSFTWKTLKAADKYLSALRLERLKNIIVD